MQPFVDVESFAAGGKHGAPEASSSAEMPSKNFILAPVCSSNSARSEESPFRY